MSNTGHEFQFPHHLSTFLVPTAKPGHLLYGKNAHSASGNVGLVSFESETKAHMLAQRMFADIVYI